MSIVVIVLVLVVVIPVGFLMTMALVAGVMGWVTKDQVDQSYAGTEELELSQRT